ncbi:MAG: diaminohydroxyphosphoribosylaminopyrimidine deaminase [Candidatus Omnitrophota bacterium]|jgi:diaminohydroxyphosphoribosylaminopyrimidine deaminase/5-amino-6-(5-phosphoribosylamino)uracil reductase
MQNNHLYWMDMAIELARKGVGVVSPNPPVGAVLVKNGKCIAKGYHKKAGRAHAEIEAIHRAKQKAKGCDLYVTLEPCSTQGKTGACTDAIIKAGIKRVFVACLDPNPEHYHKAKAILEAKGIDYESGIAEEYAEPLLRHFATSVQKKKPFITLKAAQTLDGKLATSKGDSQWVTSPLARKQAHKLRYEHDAVLVGMNTIQRDNPSLDVRLIDKQKHVTKIVLDSHLRIKPTAKVFKSPGPVIVATCSTKKSKSLEKFKKLTILRIKANNGRIDLRALLKALHELGIQSVLVEGGGEVHADFMQRGLADAFYWFIAPKFLGGKDSISAIGGKNPTLMKQAKDLCIEGIDAFGPDLAIHGLII